MIKVTLGTNLNRTSIIVDPSRTVKSVLKENNIDYAAGGIHLDGLAIIGDELNKTFTQFGIDDECILISVIKANGGYFI